MQSFGTMLTSEDHHARIDRLREKRELVLGVKGNHSDGIRLAGDRGVPGAIGADRDHIPFLKPVAQSAVVATEV